MAQLLDASERVRHVAREQVPLLPSALVRRPRLEDRLTAAVRGGVVVVDAPGGAGKTALLAQWARRTNLAPTNWVTLCTAHNDPARLRERFRRMLSGSSEGWSPHGCGHVRKPTTVTFSGSPLPPAAGGSVPAPPRVLVLDNSHLISESGLLDALVAELRRLLPEAVLIIAGRGQPDLRLHKLRVSGDLTELRAADLRFTPDESRVLLERACGRRVARADVAALTDLTEGWALGLRFAATECERGADLPQVIQRFASGASPIHDYFEREIFADLPAATSHFLLTVAGLDRMTGDLCDELTGRDDGAATLDRLARQSLFMTRLDAVGRWFRFQGPFREFLRQRAEQHDPSRVQRVRRQAAEWSLQQGDVGAAMHYQISAGALDDAFALATSSVAQHVAAAPGRISQPPVLPAEFPAEYLHSDKARLYATAAHLLYSGQCAEGAAWLQHLEAVVTSRRSDRAWRPRCHFLWALHDSLRGDSAGVLQHCRLAFSSLTTTPSCEPSDRHDVGGHEPWLSSIDADMPRHLSALAARAHLWQQRPDRARSVLARGAMADTLSSRPIQLGVHAMVACSEGRLRDAYPLAQQALQLARLDNSVHVLGVLDARLARSIVCWERDDIEDAESEIRAAMRIRHTVAEHPTHFGLEWQLIRIKLTKGHVLDAIDDISLLRADARCSARFDRALAELESRCWLAVGELNRARGVLRSHTHRRELHAAIALASHRPDRALALLRTAETVTNPRVAAERMVLLARGYAMTGQERDALDAVRRAIDVGRSEGFVRLFFDTADLLPLVMKVVPRSPDPYLARIVTHRTRSSHGAGQRFTPAEPLSPREQEILGLLPTYRSQGEIARELFISLNTVKSHVQAIYRKLGAQSRSEAVLLARANAMVD